MKLYAASKTDSGRKREANEDHVWEQVFTDSNKKDLGLFLVCDGMGGHLGGEHASYWAIEAIKFDFQPFFCPGDPRATLHLPFDDTDEEAMQEIENSLARTRSDIEELAQKAIQKANQVVFEYSQQKPQKAAEAGTTLAMAVVNDDQVLIANVGDSRTYVLRDGKLRQISKDHSLVASLVASGQLEPDEIYTHPQRNMIYRSIGQKKDVQIDLYWENLQAGDYLLLCSDGLWEMVQDDQKLARLIEKYAAPELICDRLVDAANAAGGEDNIGIVVVKIV